MSMIVCYELTYGACGSDRPSDMQDTREAADIRAHLKKCGTTIGPYDVLIAAQARRAGATLVTANTRAFERAPGLNVVDWCV